MNTCLRNNFAAFVLFSRFGLIALGIYLIALNYLKNEELRPPIGIALSPSQQQIGVLFEGEPVTIFDVKNDHRVTNLNFVYRAEQRWLDKATYQSKPKIAFLSDERLLIVVEQDNAPADGFINKQLQLIEWDIPGNREVSHTPFDNVIDWIICESQKQVVIHFQLPSSLPETNPHTNILKIWDLSAKRFIAEIANIKGRLVRSTDGDRLAAFSSEGMQIFDISKLTFAPLNSSQGSFLAVDPTSGRTLVTSWDMQPNRFKNTETPNLAILHEDNKYALENSADEPKTLIQFFGNGKYISSSMGHGIGVWTADDGKRIGWYECPYQTVISLAGSSSGDSLAIGRYGEIIRWDLITGQTSEIWSHHKANPYFKRASGWLAAILCLSIALCPAFTASNFTESKRLDSLASMTIRLSLILYAISLAAPALVFTNVDGSTTTLRGIQALTMGWQAAILSQFGWFANILIAIGVVAALCRAWVAAAVLGTLASLVALNTYTLLWSPLPGFDNADTGGQLTELAIGFYFWLSALISYTLFAMMKIYRGRQDI